MVLSVLSAYLPISIRPFFHWMRICRSFIFILHWNTLRQFLTNFVRVVPTSLKLGGLLVVALYIYGTVGTDLFRNLYAIAIQWGICLIAELILM